MRQGATISGGMHLALLLAVLLSGSLFKSRDAELIQIAEVSLISAEAFDAAASAAPSVPAAEPEALAEPVEPEAGAVTPETEVPPEVAEPGNPETPDPADAGPDVSGLQALEEPVVEAPVQPDVIAEDAAPLGESPIAPAAIGNEAPTEAVVPSELTAAEPVSTDAPRIDTESAPEQPDDAETSSETVEETVPVEAEDVAVEEEVTPEAPEEATAEVVPDVAEQSAMAPVAASRPRGRPENLEAQVIAARKAAEAAEVAAAAAAAELEAAAETGAQAEAEAAIAEALEIASAEANEATAEPEPQSLGSGMTAGEKDGLRLAVQKCWNVPAGLANAGELVVVVGVELAQDGSLAGSPYLIEPTGERGEGFRQAFEAGRRALIRCAPYDLPPEKYEQWRKLEVVFNPKNMVVR